MTLVASFASFFLKKSTNGGSILSIISNKYLYIGGFLGSICYIWTMLIAGIFLKEKIGLGKIIGVLLILSGVVCVAV
jgi:drug/metabolite transporter (DMT)-like permease